MIGDYEEEEEEEIPIEGFKKINKSEIPINLINKKDLLNCAINIGIDPEKESNLLYLAKEVLISPVPSPWEIVSEDDNIFYYNNKTKEKTTQNPLDEIYRKLVIKERNALIHGNPKSNKLKKHLQLANDINSKAEELNKIEESFDEDNENLNLDDLDDDLKEEILEIEKKHLEEIETLEENHEILIRDINLKYEKKFEVDFNIFLKILY